MAKHIVFGWYGGTFSHLDWLRPLLPNATHFCDVFGIHNPANLSTTSLHNSRNSMTLAIDCKRLPNML